MEPTHPDPDVAAALRQWGVKPGSHQESQAAILFPDFEALRAFYVKVLPEDFHHNFQRYRAVHAGSTPYDLYHILKLVSELDIFPAQLPHAAIYVNLLGLGHPEQKPESRRRMYDDFGVLSRITIPYAESVFNGPGMDWRVQHSLTTMLESVIYFERSHIPAEYVRDLDITRRSENWNVNRVASLYASRVPAAYVSQLPTWRESSITRFKQLNVPPDYANKLLPLDAWGDYREKENHDCKSVILLHDANVPEAYAAHALALGLDAETIIDCHQRDIAMEYLEEL